MKNNKGFTLLELIIVLFLITIIISLSIISFANFLPTHKFHSTVRDISSTIRHARLLAQIHGERQILTIDLDEKKYGIEGGKTKEIPPEIQIKIIDPLLGEVESEKYRFIIQSIGMEGGSIVLSDNSRTARIEIDPVIGSVVIK